MGRTMFSLILFLLTTATWAGTLRYDFSDERQFDDWQSELKGVETFWDQKAEWFVENGELVCISKNACSIASGRYIGDETWEDYVFSFQFKIEQTFPSDCEDPFWNSSAVIGLAHSRAGNTRKAARMIWDGSHAIGTGGWEQSVCGIDISPTPSELVFQLSSFAIEEGKWYTWRIVAENNHYQTFIDDHPICEIEGTSTDFAKGLAGLAARDALVHFDNVVITGDTIPETITAVSPKAKLTTTWGEIKRKK